MNLTWLYVVAIYALAVWAARRCGVELPWRVAALFYALVLIFLFRPMTQAFVNLPVDFVQLLAPWAYLNRHPHAYNQELNDLALQIVPWAEQVRESWRSLHVPLWNARSGSGYPLLGSGQSSALSILRLIALLLPLGQAFTAEAAMKILIALTFMYLYLRKRAASEIASVAGAIAFGFSTFIIVWLHFPLVSTTCFFPAAMLALELLVERITYARFVFGAVIWTLMIFGGHPETVAHVFFFALLTLLWILFVERRFKTWREALRFVGALCGVLIVAALLASPFLATFAEGIKRSKRFQELQVQPNVVGIYSDWTSRIILISPHFFGEVPTHWTWGAAHAESITAFAGILGAAGWFALLIDSIRRRRFRSREFFLVVVTPILLGIVLAWPVVSTVFHAVFRLAANARLRLLLCFVSSMMTAALIDLAWASESTNEADRNVCPTNYLLGIAGASGLLLAIWFSVPWPDNQFFKDIALLALLPSMVTLIIAACVVFERRLVLLVLVAIVAELWKVDRGWNPVVPERLMYPKTPLITALRDEIDKGAQPCRIVASGPTFFSNVPAVYGFEDIRAHDPMANGRYLGMLRVVAGYDTSDYFAQWQNFETRMLDYLNVCYVVTPPRFEMADKERYSVVYDKRDGRVFHNNSVLPRFYAPPFVVLEFNTDVYTRRLMQQQDFSHTVVLRRLPVENDQERNDLLAPRSPSAPLATVRIMKATDTEYDLVVDAPRYTMVVSSLPSWPGWRVERNGDPYDPLEPNGSFLGFVVRPGRTHVRVYYSPTVFNVSAAVSLVTLAALAALSRGSLRRRLAAARGSAAAT